MDITFTTAEGILCTEPLAALHFPLQVAVNVSTSSVPAVCLIRSPHSYSSYNAAILDIRIVSSSRILEVHVQAQGDNSLSYGATFRGLPCLPPNLNCGDNATSSTSSPSSPCSPAGPSRGAAQAFAATIPASQAYPDWRVLKLCFASARGATGGLCTVYGIHLLPANCTSSGEGDAATAGAGFGAAVPTSSIASTSPGETAHRSHGDTCIAGSTADTIPAAVATSAGSVGGDVRMMGMAPVVMAMVKNATATDPGAMEEQQSTSCSIEAKRVPFTTETTSGTGIGVSCSSTAPALPSPCSLSSAPSSSITSPAFAAGTGSASVSAAAVEGASIMAGGGPGRGHHVVAPGGTAPAVGSQMQQLRELLFRAAASVPPPKQHPNPVQQVRPGDNSMTTSSGAPTDTAPATAAATLSLGAPLSSHAVPSMAPAVPSAAKANLGLAAALARSLLQAQSQAQPLTHIPTPGSSDPSFGTEAPAPQLQLQQERQPSLPPAAPAMTAAAPPPPGITSSVPSPPFGFGLLSAPLASAAAQLTDVCERVRRIEEHLVARPMGQFGSVVTDHVAGADPGTGRAIQGLRPPAQPGQQVPAAGLTEEQLTLPSGPPPSGPFSPGSVVEQLLSSLPAITAGMARLEAAMVRQSAQLGELSHQVAEMQRRLDAAAAGSDA